MRRRTFMQAVGAIATFPFLPKLDVRGIPRWVIDRACDDGVYSGSRYNLTEPAIQNGTGFATDGRVMLQLDDVQDFASAEELGRFPNCTKLISDLWESGTGNWRSWKTEQVDGDYLGVCLDCWGTEFQGESKECEECSKYCDGDIFDYPVVYAFEYRPDTHPPDMPVELVKDYPGKDWEDVHKDFYNGDGGPVVYTLKHRHCHNGMIGKVCETCKGTGYIGEFAHQLDGRRVANQYAHLVSHLPNVEYRFQQKYLGTTGIQDQTDAIRFRFDGGRGLLMPLCEKY